MREDDEVDGRWAITYGYDQSEYPEGDGIGDGNSAGFAAYTTWDQGGEEDINYLETNPECSEEETEDPPPADTSGCGTKTAPGEIDATLVVNRRKGYTIRLDNGAGLTTEMQDDFDSACPGDGAASSAGYLDTLKGIENIRIGTVHIPLRAMVKGPIQKRTFTSQGSQKMPPRFDQPKWSFSWSMTWRPFRAKRRPCVAYADELLHHASRPDAVVKMTARDHREAVEDCRLGRGLDGVCEPE